MQSISAITIFCEDIREEKSGTELLLGILPDNVNVPGFPFVFPKMSFYTRVHLDPEYDPKSLVIVLKSVDGERELTTISDDLIKKTRSDAKASQAPLAGIISRTITARFTVLKPGRMIVILRAGDQEIICGALNVQKVPDI